MYHRNLDDIGRRPLDGGIDGIALGKATNSSIRRIDITQVATAVTDGLGVAQLPRLIDTLLHKSMNTRIGGKIVVNELLGLRPADTQTFCEAEGGDSIDDAEVGSLGAATFLTRNLFDTFCQIFALVENLGGSGSMNIMTEAEILNKPFIATEMSHDAEFYLGIVRREEQLPWCWDEGFANLLAVFCAHRDILQIRIAAGEATGGCYRLIEVGVDAARTRIDELGQRIEVGADELLLAAILENLVHNGMLSTDALQDLLVRGIGSSLGFLRVGQQPQAVEEHFSHLFRRIDIEDLTCQLVNLLLEVRELIRQQFTALAQGLCIQTDTRTLHICQNRHQRHFYLLEQMQGTFGFEQWKEDILQAQRDVSILSGISTDLFHRHLAHRLLCLTALFLTNQFFDVDGLITQIRLSKIVHTVMHFRLQKIVSYHRVKHWFCKPHAVVLQDGEVILQVLSNLENTLVLIHGSEFIDNSLSLCTIFGNRDIVSLTFLDGKAQPHQLRIDCFF